MAPEIPGWIRGLKFSGRDPSPKRPSNSLTRMMLRDRASPDEAKIKTERSENSNERFAAGVSQSWERPIHLI
jgi:hypothetical protein